MDRTLFAATLAIAAFTSLAQSLEQASPAPAATSAPATAGARPLLPVDFLAAELTLANDETDRMACEVVDILLRDGRELLAG